MRRINLILLILVAITCTCNAQNIEGDWMSDSLFANHGGGYFLKKIIYLHMLLVDMMVYREVVI